MKHAFLGVYVLAMVGAAQADATGMPGASPVQLSRHDRQWLAMGAENSEPCGSLAAALAAPPYAGNEYHYVDGLSYALWIGTVWAPGYPGAGTSTWVEVNSPGHATPRSGGFGHAPRNGDHQRNPLSYAVLSGQGGHYITRDPSLDVLDSHARDVDHDGSAGQLEHDGAAPVEEAETRASAPQVITMLLAGLGLLALGARRRRSDPFE